MATGIKRMTARWVKAMGLFGIIAAAMLVPRVAAAAEWQSLIGDDSVPAWRGWNSSGLPAGWQIRDGVLTKHGEVEDLVSVRDYGSFELEFEWRMGEGGNSGVFYRGTRDYDHLYWSAPEYQLLDDAHAGDGRNRLTAAGGAYGLYGVPPGVVHEAGRWNRSRVVVRGTRVEHWLNGRRVVSYRLLSEDWSVRVQASKFAAYPGYGRAPHGLLGIQGDHPGDLAMRRMRKREHAP